MLTERRRTTQPSLPALSRQSIILRKEMDPRVKLAGDAAEDTILH
jgi:hypothetical protein